MQTRTLESFYADLHKKNVPFPFDAVFELTYRCNLNCVHCYCQGSEKAGCELGTPEIKKILAELQQAGCLWLTFSGGEPLMRSDFLEIYTDAKKKGFIITLLTNGLLLERGIIRELVKFPPHSIEITLNAITRRTYEKITRVKGVFGRVIKNIQLLAKEKLPLIIKTNLLKQNKAEVARIKKWTEKLLGKSKQGYNFKYDPIIYPRLNGGKTPCKYRLSFKEMLEVVNEDEEMLSQYLETRQEYFRGLLPKDNQALYRCNSWMAEMFINPFGRLKFCLFSEKSSVNLGETGFKEGFYNLLQRILEEKFKTHSACAGCRLRLFCLWCPAKAKLETGNEEKPIPYYCKWAKAMAGNKLING